MSGVSGEQEILSNKFGAISDKRVIFLSNKSLLGSGSKQEIPLKQIASVKFFKKKSFIAIIVGLLGIVLSIAIITVFSGNLMAIIGGLIALTFGVWMIYFGVSGMPIVILTTSDGKVSQASGWPNDKNEAKAFFLVLREKTGA